MDYVPRSQTSKWWNYGLNSGTVVPEPVHLTATQCHPWARPLFCKGAVVFCGVKVPPLISSVPFWWAFRWFAICCHEEQHSDVWMCLLLTSWAHLLPWQIPPAAGSLDHWIKDSTLPSARHSDLVLWGCLFHPFPWQYHHWWFRLQFLIFNDLLIFSFWVTCLLHCLFLKFGHLLFS